MLFNSPQFLLIFLPLTLAAFFTAGNSSRSRYAEAILVAASLIFYGWDNPKRLVPLIICSIAFNYAVGLRLARRRERGTLVVGIVSNLAVLGYFKYAGFLTENLAGVGLPVPILHVALPIGISFFTFTQIAFLVDAYRGLAREYHAIHYALFVTFFPHLVAGPILHHSEMMPQFERRETYKPDMAALATGLTWFALGLAKKALLADSIAPYSDAVFKLADAAKPVTTTDAWFGAAAYATQIYFDFSGYSDMAIGLALMFGITFPLNFFSPYKSASMVEFWRRWHMTLSRFLRDYLYIPLGGNRKGPARRYINLMITMLLGGLWHGASWNFVLWGGIHGAALSINHVWNNVAGSRGWRLPNCIGQVFTLFIVLLAWVPFRANTLTASVGIWKAMAGIAPHHLTTQDSSAWILLASLWAIALFMPNTAQVLAQGEAVTRYLPKPLARGWFAAAIGAVLGSAMAVSFFQPSAFLYFRF